MRAFVVEERRPKLSNMKAQEVFDELVEDAAMFHPTALFRFSPAIQYLSKKWRKSPEVVFLQLEEAAKLRNGYGLPRQPASHLR